MAETTWLPCEYWELEHWGFTKAQEQSETLLLSGTIWGGPSPRPRSPHIDRAKYGLTVPIALRGVPAGERSQVIQAHKEALRPLLCAMLAQRETVPPARRR